DGISQGIFEREFMELLANRPLAPQRFQYKDYSCWRNSEVQQRALKRRKYYWLERFSGDLPVLDLPIDYPRPAVQTFEGGHNGFSIGIKETARLRAFAESVNTTPYMVLSAIFNVFLARLGRREDIIIGTPVAGRRHTDLENIIGMFVNTLALRNFPSGEKTFRTFLDEVKERTLADLENQDYPFEYLVDNIVLERDTSRNPLFDVMFSLTNVAADPGKSTGAEQEQRFDEYGISKFDLSLDISLGNSMTCIFEYSTRLFKEETIERMGRYFKTIAYSVISDADQRLSQIEILSQAEREQLVVDFNRTELEYPKDKTV
ncbi:MAG: non-ribosomal peptide synthetase, partial [bacterium]|nr:non-ribosomal peptide synthetase [bacterium]